MWVRRSPGQIEVDHQLKLRIANAIHTAMVYLMVRQAGRQEGLIHREGSMVHQASSSS